MIIKMNRERYYLWRAVDADGYELDILLQKRRNKKAALRFIKRLLGSYPTPRVIITDKLKSYNKPIRSIFPNTDHRKHKRLNNRVEHAHQPTRRKEKCLIKFKSLHHAQRTITLMGQIRNLFAVYSHRYLDSASARRSKFYQARAIWNQVALQAICT